MKNRNRYYNQALENLIKSKLISLKEKVRISSSTSYAARNLPALIQDHMNIYYEEHHYVCQELINEVNSTLQFKTTVNETVQSNDQAYKNALVQNNDLASEQTKEADLEAQAKTCKPANRFIRPMILVAIALVSLFEGLMALPVFEKWGFTLIVAGLLSLLFAGVLAIFAHLLPRIIRLGKTNWQRVLIALILAIFFTILFKYMADERALYLMKTTNSGPVNPYPFVVASILLLGTTVAISYFYMPSTEELNKIKEYNEIIKELNKTRANINNLKKKTKTDKIAQDEFVNESGSLLVYGYSLEQMIINHAYEYYNLFKTNNLLHRPDGGKPDCFDEPYPFTFTTYFHTINGLIDENN